MRVPRVMYPCSRMSPPNILIISNLDRHNWMRIPFVRAKTLFLMDDYDMHNEKNWPHFEDGAVLEVSCKFELECGGN